MKSLLLLLISFLLMTGVATCCSKSLEESGNQEELMIKEVQEESEKYDMDIEWKIMLRNNADEDFQLITDEIIHNNVFYLLKSILSNDKIVVSEDGEVPFTHSKQIKISDLTEVDYIISFSTYYVNKKNDGGRRAIIIEHGDDIQYYYVINQLDNYISLALTNERTFTAKVVGMWENKVTVVSDIFDCLEFEYEYLPEDVIEGTLIEITLGKLLDENSELFAQSIRLNE